MGCASNQKFATLQDGACNAFPRPQFQVKGQTSYDQRWADETTEAGVAGCGWHRPQVRPASLTPSQPSPKATFKQRWLHKFFRDRATQ